MIAISRHPLPASASRGLLTSEEFLEWLEPGIHADLIDGQVSLHSPANLRHARLLNFFDSLLRQYVERKDLGELHREQVAVRFDSQTTFMPDLSFFSKAQVARIPETHVPFASTFVLEVLSPATARRDRGPKFAAYERHHVQESWILDPQKLEHRFYRPAGDLLAEFAQLTDRIDSSSIPGFWVKRNWLNPDSHSLISQCLAEVLGIRTGKSRFRR